MNTTKALPEIVSEIMEFHGWTQKELADHYGVNKAQVTRWLQGAVAKYDLQCRLRTDYEKIQKLKKVG